MQPFNGMQVRTDIHLTVPFEDWSKVRSPARARRRRKSGHKQRIQILQLPDPQVFVAGGCIYGHPETIRVLLANAKETQS